MSCFGELNEPSSRALCDFEDELTENSSITELSWEGNTDVPEKIPLLLFAEGTAAMDLFQNSIILNAKLICRCKINGVSIYKLNNNEDKYVCLLESAKDFLEVEVVDSIKPWINASKNVLILHSANIVKYQTRHTGEPPNFVLRMLEYSIEKDKSEKPLLKTLEQPNFITDTAAAIFSYRIFLNKPAILLVCYLDILWLDSIIAKQILDVLRQFNIPSVPYTAKPPKLNSNLYM